MKRADSNSIFKMSKPKLRERLKLYEDICFATDGTKLLQVAKNDPLTMEQLWEMDALPGHGYRG